jgi:N-acyl-L-homoserine lactone synthetase
MLVVQNLQQRGLDDKIGRAHVYRPKRFRERLDLIVALRNKIEHDKDGYWSDDNLRALAGDLGPVVADSARLIIPTGPTLSTFSGNRFRQAFRLRQRFQFIAQKLSNLGNRFRL